MVVLFGGVGEIGQPDGATRASTSKMGGAAQGVEVGGGGVGGWKEIDEC